MTDALYLGHTSEFPTASLTRPANTDPYTAGDVIGDDASGSAVMTFADCGRSDGGKGMIASAMIVGSASQATQPDLELWIFKTAPAAVADNAAWAPTDVELESLVGIIAFPSVYVGKATVGAGGNLVLKSDVEMLGFECASGSTALYGVLVVRNAYTPVSAESFKPRLAVLQDF